MVFSKYLMCDDPVEITIEDGEATGFSFKMCHDSYRGLTLSYIRDLKVILDGEEFSMKDKNVTLTVAEGTFTAQDLPTLAYSRWNFCEKAVISVKRPGGIAAGEHHLEAGYSARGMTEMMIGNDYIGGFRDFTV